LQTLLLLFISAFFCAVEIKSSYKGTLWRIIFCCGIFAEFAKVLRTGLLLNPSNRSTMDVFLYVLYNTHACFSSICFITLLFFWARLYHDLVPNKKVFGKLFPAYIFFVVFVCFFYYLQVIVYSVASTAATIAWCSIATGVISFVIATSYLAYSALLWQTFIKTADRRNIFFKMFLSAFLSSIVVLLIVVFVLAFDFVDFDSTTAQFVVRHSIYESLYLCLFISFLSGFVIHFVQNFVLGVSGSINLSRANHSTDTTEGQSRVTASASQQYSVESSY